ncbi:CD48 antigen [Manis pentadactyla]|uniref:CD48 antigen n=1 Tax=Manis pentadactyla TaxID=143292 RepID=UPI00255CA8A1|nr:CD48 antigen [Manis pentadactyla]
MRSKRCDERLALKFLLRLHLFLATSTQGHSERLVTALSGSNVSLQIHNLPKNYQQLTWFYTTNQKIVEWEFNKTNYFNFKFKDRVMLDHQSFALYIYKVQKEDSSTYLVRVLKEAGDEEEWKVTLQVFDPVPKPAIKIENTREVDNNCDLKLSCAVPEQSVRYTWYGDSGPVLKDLQSAVLEVTVTPSNYSRFYTCEISNPVSSENDTVYFTLPCKLARSSGVSWTAARLMVLVLIVGPMLT